LFLFILSALLLPSLPSTPTKSVDSSILCAFCQKNFFFATKLHKKKIIVVGEID
jgi:hypothetical protein